MRLFTHSKPLQLNLEENQFEYKRLRDRDVHRYADYDGLR